MKKIFALFCAVCLMPSFSAQAWIGGPFSNNAFFGETGADGVYEASASAVNGIGLYRIVVGNQFQGAGSAQVQNTGDAASTVTSAGNVGRPIGYTQIKSGNTVIGAAGSPWSNVWYYRGVSYFGRTLGTANFATGLVTGAAEAYSSDVLKASQPITQGFQGTIININIPPSAFLPQDLTPVSFISSSFKAQIKSSGQLIAARTFRGTGRGRLRFSSTAALGRPTPRPQNFQFTVFGSKVSDNILLGL
jgi:hypothetical protein